MPAADETTLELLEEALGLLGAAWLRLGGQAPTEPHPEAVEAALRASETYQEARREVADLLRRLLDDGVNTDLLLDLEAAQNAAAAEALEVGYRLGATMGGGER